RTRLLERAPVDGRDRRVRREILTPDSRAGDRDLLDTAVCGLLRRCRPVRRDRKGRAQDCCAGYRRSRRPRATEANGGPVAPGRSPKRFGNRIAQRGDARTTDGETIDRCLHLLIPLYKGTSAIEPGWHSPAC